MSGQLKLHVAMAKISSKIGCFLVLGFCPAILGVKGLYFMQSWASCLLLEKVVERLPEGFPERCYSSSEPLDTPSVKVTPGKAGGLFIGAPRRGCS